MTRPVLPTFYYLDHFMEMLRFVTEIYRPVLSVEHHKFVADFGALSKDAQCLLVRMVNRRGQVFNPATFRYAEISDAMAALGELMATGQARALDGDDYAAFLMCLPKTVLVQGAKTAGLDAVRRTWSKPQLIDCFVRDVAFEKAHACCGGDGFVALAYLKPLQFLLYLYFGKTENNLKNFALRDLGIMRTNAAASFSARFTDSEEAHACFHYSQLLDRLEIQTSAVYEQSIDALFHGPLPTTDHAAELKSRAACQIGQFFEKRGDRELAGSLYRVGTSPECHEKLVRLLYAGRDKAAAEELLRRMIEDPASDEELIFATDFYERKFGGKRTGPCMELLRTGRIITVDDIRRNNPEAGVASVMRREGWQVFFTENTLWRSLFGLLFWEELFETGQIYTGFDWMPQGLKDRTFRRTFSAQIDAKLQALQRGAGLNIVLRVIAAKWGTPNGVFGWDHVHVEALRALLETAAPSAIAAVLDAMTRDYSATHDGFPDLMLVRDSELLFLEVKAQGDAVRRNQLARLRQLRNVGISAEIARVEYTFDPDQDYVVVDIETTGSWGNGDRVTEIGAVKIRNHEVVAEWHSLVNPQRSIPGRITQLTGITNEMVRDGPVFAEIADSFMAFIDDAIFVAHSVNFDYGFIAAEYQRLGRRFRFPKLCTCAGMRRSHPGHKSYGLASLCAFYQIELDSHHRALCDARAAGHLLNLINRKRDGGRAASVTIAA